MAKLRSRPLDFLVYAVIRVLGCVVQIMPPDLSLSFVRALADLAHRFNRRHREVAKDNIRQAFPGRYGEEELRDFVRDVYRHFAMMMLETALLPRKFTRGTYGRYVDLSETEPLRKAIASDRPVLNVTAHYGNWELSSYVYGLVFGPANVVGRPLDNPYLDDWIRRFRESTGHTMLSKKGDLGRMRAILADGAAVCTLGDQDAGDRGVFVDFFGRPASTHKVMAFLAMKTNAIICVSAFQNQGLLLRYVWRVADMIDPEEYENHPDAALAITQRITTGLERIIRGDPRQYFWLHRRWKSQPTTDQAAKAA